MENNTVLCEDVVVFILSHCMRTVQLEAEVQEPRYWCCSQQYYTADVDSEKAQGLTYFDKVMMMQALPLQEQATHS